MNLTNDVLFLDVETSIHNNGNPFDTRNFLVSYADLLNDNVSFKYYTDPDLRTFIRSSVDTCRRVVGFNIKFDIHWLRNLGINIPDDVEIWDCQLAEFIYSGQTLPYDSLDAACERYGLAKKPDQVAEYWSRGISSEDIPIPILEERNRHDVVELRELYKIQQGLLSDKQKQLVILEGEDLRTLQAAEYAGIKFNTEEALSTIQRQDGEVAETTRRLSAFLPSGIPDGCFNWNSGDHLSAFLYGGVVEFDYSTPENAVYKSGAKKGQEYVKNNWHSTKVAFPQRFVPLKGTLVAKSTDQFTGKPYTDRTLFYQTDQPTLQQLKARSNEAKEILSLLEELALNSKVGEMAASIIKKMTAMHWADNYIHGQFNQNVVVTGRLSSSGPNLQNQPPEIDKLLITRY